MPVLPIVMRACLALLALLAAVASVPVTANAATLPGQRLQLSAGAFFPSVEANLQARPEASMHRRFELEDAFDRRRDRDVARFSSALRVGHRHRLFGEYFAIAASGDTVASRDLVFGNLAIPAGSGVEGNFEFSGLQVHYGYSLHRSERTEAAVLLGVTKLRIDARASAFLPDRPLGEDEVSALGAVPVFGLKFEHALSRSWLLRAQFSGIEVDLGPYDGTLLNHGVSLERLIAGGLGIGVAYASTRTNLRVDAEDWNGALRLVVNGPLAYLTLRF